MCSISSFISGFSDNLATKAFATVLPPSFLTIFLNSLIKSSFELQYSSASLYEVLPFSPTAASPKTFLFSDNLNYHHLPTGHLGYLNRMKLLINQFYKIVPIRYPILGNSQVD